MNDPQAKLKDLYNKINSSLGRREIINNFSQIDVNDRTQADNFFQQYGAGNYDSERGKLPYWLRDHIGRVDAYLDLADLVKAR